MKLTAFDTAKLEKDFLTVRDNRVAVLVDTYADCPDCAYNPVTKSSKNPKCSTCGGKGRIKVSAETEVLARVAWGETRLFRPTEGGALAQGECTLLVSRKDEALFVLKRRVRVDGRVLGVQATTYAGSFKLIVVLGQVSTV